MKSMTHQVETTKTSYRGSAYNAGVLMRIQSTFNPFI